MTNNVVNIDDQMLRNEPILFDEVDHDAYSPRPSAEQMLRDAATTERGALLVGPPGSGRTTTLNWLAKQLAPERAVAYVDASLSDTAAALLEAMRLALIDAMDNQPDSASAPLREPLHLGEARTEPVRLQAMVRQLGSVSPATILIDNLANPAVIRTLFGGLRELLWQTRHTYVASSQPQDLPVFLAPPADSFLKRRVELRPLTDEELKNLVALSGSPTNEALERVGDTRRQPRDIITALESASAGGQISASVPDDLNPAAAELWRELVILDRPVTVNDDELRARANRSPFTIRRHLNELVEAGLVSKLSDRTGQPGRPALKYMPRRIPG